VKEMAKNMKSISLINKNIIVAAEIKKLKIQILKLKVKLREFKYIFKEDQKLS